MSRAPGIARPARTPAPPAVRDALATPARPLDARLRTQMESRFAHDFSQVRIHADAAAARSARAVDAQAYTVGSHIVFDDRRYAPHSTAGQQLLAHELAHVAQQRSTSPAVPRNPQLAAEDSAAEREARAAAVSPRPLAARADTAGLLHRTPNPGATSDPAVAEPAGADTAGADAGSLNPVIAQFDAERYPGWQHWNLDKLSAELVRWMQAAPDHYATIQGNHGGDAKDSADPEYTSYEAAKRRADSVRNALQQWAPQLKGRLRVDTMLRELITDGKAYLSRQITILRGSGAAGARLTPPAPTGSQSPLGPRSFVPIAPPAPSPYRPSSPFAGIESTIAGIVHEQPDKPGEQKSDFKKFFEAATSKGWDVTVSGQQIVNLSIKGVARTLYHGDGLDVKATLGPSFKLDITRGPVVFGSSLSLSSGDWEVKLSFPGDTPPPDLAILERVMSNGKTAILKAASTAVSPATFDAAAKGDFSSVIDQISPLVEPIGNAVDQVQGFRKMKPGLSFGIAAGSGAGPAVVADEKKGVYIRGVLTLSF